MDGYPDTLRLDLRYYIDTHGRFTPRLREHFTPAAPNPDERQVFIKAGSAWLLVDYYLLVRGMVFRVRDPSTGFVALEGETAMFALADAYENREGVWGVRARPATRQELLEA